MIVLSVDTAANSGWCLTQDGVYVDSGECEAFGAELPWICKRATALDKRALLMLEKPSHGNRSQLVGMGAARGAWMAGWNAAQGKKPKDVFPATWRSDLFGNTAKNHTQERLTAQIFSKKAELGPDEAAAVCIAAWQSRKAKFDVRVSKVRSEVRAGGSVHRSRVQPNEVGSARGGAAQPRRAKTPSRVYGRKV